jgi:predicted helicase
MSGHEDELKRHQEAGFVTLHEKIEALKNYIEVFTNERQKYSKADYDKLVKELEDAETACKSQVDTYIKHLEENVDMYRKSIAGAS